MAKIISLANQKGGVGKTTSAINLAGALAELGHSVLAIDMDPQQNLTVGLGVSPASIERSMANVLAEEETELRRVVVPSSTPGIDLAPADIDLAATEANLISRMGRDFILRDAVQGWARESYDWIVIDCPPNLGMLTVNSLVASDGVVVPVQPQYFALKGLRQIEKGVVQIRQRLNPDLRILGILATFYDGRTNLSQQMMDELRDDPERYIFATRIRQAVKLGEAALVGRPVTAYAPTSEAARAYRELAQEVIERA